MPKKKDPNLPLPPEEIIKDYRLAYKSRQASLIGRREVLSGKAKFGIFGDGKEVIQLAIARSFKKGDWRSGYYRDQTWMFALGVLTYQEFFAQLYAHADVEAEPATAGRSMNAHYATRFLDSEGNWLSQTEGFNVAADISPTGSQMPRLVGLAFASNLYRNIEELKKIDQFSKEGNEVAWGSIGNASTAEGMFWESVNAIGVLGAPAIISVYDDGYGISVPNQFQMVKENISDILSGFEREPCPAECCERGYDIYNVRAWDYAALLDVYDAAANTAREYHIPALVHVSEATQPQGHSTSGSHERYKTQERLAWEADFDCLVKMRAWMLKNDIISEEELAVYEKEDRKSVEEARAAAWDAYIQPILSELDETKRLLDDLSKVSPAGGELSRISLQLTARPNPLRRDIHSALHNALRITRAENNATRDKLLTWKQVHYKSNQERYSSHLYSQSDKTALEVEEIEPVYRDDSVNIPAFEILNACFDTALARDPRVVAFGEDVGHLGDVNQGFHGLQEKYGSLRVMDTGIREVTILGQAIGLAMRGIRPICEIQYLDYLLYVLQLMSDDLATLQWRTKGGQKAPVIIRTRGHRLEGIWHSGSPMAGLIHLVRGMYVLVPRNAVQAARFYNTLLKSDEPGIIVEVLNGYRLRERLPNNIGEITTPLGVPEILRTGSDVSLVTYGAMCRIAIDAAEKLNQVGIDLEIIDVQSLLPFDRHSIILESLKKTSRIIFADEDVPGGTTAYMMQEVIEKQAGYYWLDSAPRTLTAKAHRPAYGSDGDYWSKPSIEDIFDAVYEMMSDADPERFPAFYQ
ncbi:MAG: transketolase [Anaerolineales bacterium]|nr:transketolase [Chloroflexota bacterium]MBL6979925.1 transketolase [Anaerolineales bacterium]